MRLIDADALMNNINERIENMTGVGVAVDAAYLWALIYEEINEAPTIEPSKSTDQNGADVPSGDLVSRDTVLALINKAMDNTDNRDIQNYIFNGLRRDVHNLPSAVCDDCIWRVCNYNSVDWEKPSADIPFTKDTQCQEKNDHSGEVTEMVDLISREDAIESLRGLFDMRKSRAKVIVECFGELLNALPSADRPKGDPETETAPVVAYICDRRRCAICRGEDGGCDHTTDIKHAAHFKNVAGQYFERPYMEEEDDGNLQRIQHAL